jgi:hypothetical protein
MTLLGNISGYFINRRCNLFKALSVSKERNFQEQLSRQHDPLHHLPWWPYSVKRDLSAIFSAS